MTTITKMDSKVARLLHEASDKALAEVAAQFGMEYKRERGHYSSDIGTFTAKGTFAVATRVTEDGTVVDGAAQKAFAVSVNRIEGNGGSTFDVRTGEYKKTQQWLFPEDFGVEFTVQGKVFRLTGINLRAPKNCIQMTEVATDKDGWRCPSSTLMHALGRSNRVTEAATA